MDRIYQTIIFWLVVIIGLMAFPNVVPGASADDDATYDISARVEFNDATWDDGEWHSNDCVIYRMEFDQN